MNKVIRFPVERTRKSDLDIALEQISRIEKKKLDKLIKDLEKYIFGEPCEGRR